MKKFNVGDKVRTIDYDKKETPIIPAGLKGTVVEVYGLMFVMVKFEEPVYGNKDTWPMKPKEIELLS